MYTHTHTQASRPASTSPPVYPTSHLPFATQNRTGFLYNAVYPTLPIPNPSSSSLAAALDPTPGVRSNNISGTSSQLVSRLDEQSSERAAATNSSTSNTEDTTIQTDMSNRFARSYEHQYPDTSGSFHLQHPMFQGSNSQGQMLTQAQSSRHFPYSPTQTPSSSASTSYITPPQHATYQSRWPPDVGFSAYPDNLTLPSVTPPVGSEASQFPVFPHDYTFNSAGVSDGGLGGYASSGGVDEWMYPQSSSSFQASDGMFPELGDADASMNAGQSTGAWSSSSFDSHGRTQSRPSESFSSPAMPNYSGQASTSASAGISGGYFSEHHPRQRQQLEQSAGQERYQGGTQVPDEETQESFLISELRQPSSSQHSTPPSDHSASAATQAVDKGQRNGGPQRHRGHNTLMPPPPLPTRSHTLVLDRPQSESRPSQSRRHTVAGPPSHGELAQSDDTSPASSLASTSMRPSSTAPESSSSSSLHGDSTTTDGVATTPRLATLSLNDNQWALAQGINRQGLAESFRTLHGLRDAPSKLLEQTSALERSQRLDGALVGIKGLKGVQSAHGQSDEADSSEQYGHTSKGNNTTSGLTAPGGSDNTVGEDFFNTSGTDWVPALPPYEIDANSASLDAHGNPKSPTSPTTTEELVTPGDAIAPSAIRQSRVPYPYATPANPDEPVKAASPTSMRNILSLIRPDGHLASHVSGLGGSFQNAYDGRSYLTDDSEDDPEHVPAAPPGARSGDHPALATFLPHPMAKRGQTWHDMTSPVPLSPASRERLCQRSGMDDAVSNSDAEGMNDDDEGTLKKIEKEGIKKEEQGEGWGLVEAGSHGPHFAAGADRTGPGNKRVKLTTDKKTPPKMACHFCRNRKIACGASKCGDPTICNQCERRNIRCIFPTISRRGMRTRNQRSAHTVDGTDEADKDSVEHEESPGRADIQMVAHNPMEGSSTTSVPRKAGKGRKPVGRGAKEKETTRGKGRGKGRKKAETSEDNQEGSSKRTNEDTEMEDDERGISSGTQVGRLSGYADDPLASLAADMNWSDREHQSLPSPSSLQFNSRPPTDFSPPTSLSTSSLSAALHFPLSSFPYAPSTPSDTYSFQVEPSSGPFTSNPLQRRNQ